ncbi:MAG: hypothetical protein LBJ73_00110 [Rickettsiales bacterium]|jgi:hypothetical protein|nr:hypothetical protein [Rickettsiales bacterium]
MFQKKRNKECQIYQKPQKATHTHTHTHTHTQVKRCGRVLVVFCFLIIFPEKSYSAWDVAIAEVAKLGQTKEGQRSMGLSNNILTPMSKAAGNAIENTANKKAIFRDNSNQNAAVSQTESVQISNTPTAQGAHQDTEETQGNSMLDAVAIGAMGIGVSQIMQGMAEKKADESATLEMNAYMATFRCGIGDQGQNIQYGQSSEIPGYSAEFMSLKQQYRALAAQLKETKQALGLKPGIESEEILDSAVTGLYDNKSVGKTKNVFDTAQERLDSGDAKKKINTGMVVTGVGLAAGVASNVINSKGSNQSEQSIMSGTYRPAHMSGENMSNPLGGLGAFR